jgi:RNA polymerase sigma-70 factor (ECF subfamily)
MDSNRHTEFLTQLIRCERPLGAYVYGLVNHTADAEDILQLTKLQMWRLFDQFEEGGNFLAWARKVAFYQMLNFRRAGKPVHLPLSGDILESLGTAVAELSNQGDRRRDALEHCLGKLPVNHRRLILLRYFEEMEVPSLAAQIGMTVAAVYRSLSRVRLNLLNCIERETGPDRTGTPTK